MSLIVNLVRGPMFGERTSPKCIELNVINIRRVQFVTNSKPLCV